MSSLRSFRSFAFIAAASLTFSMCAKTDSGPTAPTQPAAPQPAPAPTPTPSPITASVTVTVQPNPVPQSGVPITDAAGCANVKFTWFYDQDIAEGAGASVTFTNRVDSFDGRDVNNLANLNMTVGAKATMAVKTRWCSSTAAQHTAQTRWSGIDANGHQISVTGPVVTLLKP